MPLKDSIDVFCFQSFVPWLTKTSFYHDWDDLEAATPSGIFINVQNKSQLYLKLGFKVILVTGSSCSSGSTCGSGYRYHGLVLHLGV